MWRMTTVGHAIFHEYTHWDTILKDILPAGDIVGDRDQGDKIVYGSYEIQQLLKDDEDQPVYVADSYAWFATEAWWTIKCKSITDLYDPAEPGDGADPRCDNAVCQEEPPRG